MEERCGQPAGMAEKGGGGGGGPPTSAVHHALHLMANVLRTSQALCARLVVEDFAKRLGEEAHLQQRELSEAAQKARRALALSAGLQEPSLAKCSAIHVAYCASRPSSTGSRWLCCVGVQQS